MQARARARLRKAVVRIERPALEQQLRPEQRLRSEQAPEAPEELEAVPQAWWVKHPAALASEGQASVPRAEPE